MFGNYIEPGYFLTFSFLPHGFVFCGDVTRHSLHLLFVISYIYNRGFADLSVISKTRSKDLNHNLR